MLGRSLEIKGRELLAFLVTGEAWSSLIFSAALPGCCGAPEQREGGLCGHTRGVSVSTPSVLAALHLLHKLLHVTNKPSNRYP